MPCAFDRALRWAIAAAVATVVSSPGSWPRPAVPGTLGHTGHPVAVAGTSPYVGSHCNLATPYYTQPAARRASRRRSGLRFSGGL